MHTTLITPAELALRLDEPGWLILDCRFTLADPDKGARDYLAAHIPGARYAHLDHDLSGPVTPGLTGRHPLPAVERAAETFARLGVSDETQVVAYDEAGGALAAARAWGLLRWLGHPAVAVLDGGWQRWLAEGLPARAGAEASARAGQPPGGFRARPDAGWIKSSAEVERLRLDPEWRVFDVRSAERYHGQNETIDPVAGHVPGAFSAPYTSNLAPDGSFLPVEALRERYLELLDGRPAEQAVFYCGSGATALHSLLAVMHAGLGQANLYAGSWSEWIADPRRPIAR